MKACWKPWLLLRPTAQPPFPGAEDVCCDACGVSALWRSRRGLAKFLRRHRRCGLLSFNPLHARDLSAA